MRLQDVLRKNERGNRQGCAGTGYPNVGERDVFTVLSNQSYSPVDDHQMHDAQRCLTVGNSGRGDSSGWKAHVRRRCSDDAASYQTARQ